MGRRVTSLLFVLLLVSTHPFCVDALLKEIAGAVVGAGLVVVGGPLALGAIGFTTGGILGGSTAATLMSLSATTGYGAGAVAAMQSVGAAGFSASTIAAGALAGAGAGHAADHD